MKVFDPSIPYLHWLLRGALGSVFLYHGVTKFPALDTMAEMMALPVVVVILVAVAEALGGALVLVGGFGYDLLTRLGAGMLIPVMIGAIAMVHWGQWSFVSSETHPMGGIEFQVTLLLIQTYLVAAGNRATLTVPDDERVQTTAQEVTASKSRRVV